MAEQKENLKIGPMIINKKDIKKILCWLLIAFAANVHGQEIAERVYLQTDKPLYLAGELAYLKAFTVTPEKKPLSFSKIVYVELLDETNPKVQVKIELTGGIGEGWMELPLNLPTGLYRLTAYTRFMRNEGESVFFEKNIGIVNTFLPNQIKREAAGVSSQTYGTQDIPTLSLQTDKRSYANREKGILKLDGLPENIHTLSVSIAGKAPVAVEGVNEIRQWEKQVPSISETPLDKYTPEYEGHIINGKIIPVQTTRNTEGEILIPLLSIPGENLFLFEGQKNDLNNVSFYTANVSGVKEMSTIAYNLSENIFRIDLLSPFVEQHTKKPLPALKVDSTHFDGLLERTVALQALYAYTKDMIVQNPGDMRFQIQPSRTYILDEWTRFVVMSELTTEFISELRFRRNNSQKREIQLIKREGDIAIVVRPLVVLDGIPIMDHEIIYQYNPLLVERVNIYAEEFVYGGRKFDGVVEFLTYDRNYPALSTAQSTQIVNYAGTQAPRKLYTPDYSSETDRQSRLPDFRHTLLWEPMLQTKGKPTVDVPFYTSDFTGEFLITVEGLTKDGKIVSGTATFDVKNLSSNK